MVALLDRGNAGTRIHDEASAFVPENRGEQPFRIGARARELVRVAHSRCLDLDVDFAARAVPTWKIVMMSPHEKGNMQGIL